MVLVSEVRVWNVDLRLGRALRMIKAYLVVASSRDYAEIKLYCNLKLMVQAVRGLSI